MRVQLKPMHCFSLLQRAIMNEQTLASRVVDKMYNNDPFSRWLGIERVQEGGGHCTLEMTVRKEMLNGFSIGHGGITYSLADSALAFASNGHGKQAVSIETSISHIKPIREGDRLRAVAEEKSLSRRIGIYEVKVHNQNGVLVALFKGTVFRKDEDWFPTVD
jgi:acyl-CoA thioesterase